MKDLAHLILAVVAASASCFAIWFVLMEHGGGAGLLFCVMMTGAGSFIVGLGLGARTLRLPILGGLLPILLGFLAVIPLALWLREQIAINPNAHKLPAVDYAYLVVTVLIPCIAGIAAIRTMAGKGSAKSLSLVNTH